MNIQKQRKLLQELLVNDKLLSLDIQVIALNLFANSIGYKAVNGDIRKGFIQVLYGFCHISLEEMQSLYNRGFRNLKTSGNEVDGVKVVERISLQYNKHKRYGKLTTQLFWLKFVKED